MELFKQWTPILGGAGLIVAFIIYAALKRLPDGNDVMKILKIKPGPKIGEVLKDLFDQVVEGKLKNTKNAHTAP